MANTKKRVGILISGRGSNMLSLIAAARDPAFPAEIVCVLSNRPEAEGLRNAQSAGIRAHAIDHAHFKSRTEFEAELDKALGEAGVDLVACAGFMRLMTRAFVERWRDRMLNIHPSLLPAFPGLHTHERVLAAGVKITGCTVHFVDELLDAGPIVLQAAVPVLDQDTPQSLSARILLEEHRIYTEGIRIVLSDRWRIEGRRVITW